MSLTLRADIIATEPHSIAPSVYARYSLVRVLRTAMPATVGFFGLWAWASTIDVRWCLSGLILLMLVAPMLWGWIYLAYLLKPQAQWALARRTASLNSDGEITLQALPNDTPVNDATATTVIIQSTLTIRPDQITQSRLWNRHIAIATRHPDMQLLLIPVQSIPNNKDSLSRWLNLCPKQDLSTKFSI